jgi:hypothetical protein
VPVSGAAPACVARLSQIRVGGGREVRAVMAKRPTASRTGRPAADQPTGCSFLQSSTQAPGVVAAAAPACRPAGWCNDWLNRLIELYPLVCKLMFLIILAPHCRETPPLASECYRIVWRVLHVRRGAYGNRVVHAARATDKTQIKDESRIKI